MNELNTLMGTRFKSFEDVAEFVRRVKLVGGESFIDKLKKATIETKRE